MWPVNGVGVLDFLKRRSGTGSQSEESGDDAYTGYLDLNEEKKARLGLINAKVSLCLLAAPRKAGLIGTHSRLYWSSIELRTVRFLSIFLIP